MEAGTSPLSGTDYPGHRRPADAEYINGCQAASGSGPAGFWLLLGLLLTLLCWRRWSPVMVALLLVVVVSPGVAKAGGAELAPLPFPGVFDGGFGVGTVPVLRPGDLDLAAGYQLVSGGGQLRYPTADGARTLSVVKDLHTVALMASVGLFDRVDFSFQMPVVVASRVGEDFGSGTDGLDGWGAGDLQLMGRIEMLPRPRYPVGLGAAFFTTVPFGEAVALRGEGGWTGGFLLVVDGTIGPLLLAANAGPHLRESQNILGTARGIGLMGGLLARLAIVPRHLSLSAGVRGEYDLQGNENASPLESFAGVVGHFGNLSLSLGASIGLNDHLGAAPLRTMALLGYGHRRVQDRDGDGIADGNDRCPGLAEDADGHDDEDGCPDLDDDGDAVPDLKDACPLQAEDRDGFEDDDGCPDPDNDGDDIPDVEDECPDEAEDRDGHEDGDGCVDRDNDGDGVPDYVDSCPTEQEIRNGYEDEDGCPDELPRYLFKKGLPTVISSRLFAGQTALVSDAGMELLADVARSLRIQSEIRIRVELHTGDASDATIALELSRQRGLAVMNQLIELGVEPGRLDYVGFGNSRPQAGVRQGGWGRMELRIIER